MDHLKKVEHDVYFIAQRLKEIDKSYEIYYNLNAKCYEVHSNEQNKLSYCFRIPFKELDERALWHCLRTRSDKRDEIIKEIENNNRLLYEKNIKNQVNSIKEVLCG